MADESAAGTGQNQAAPQVSSEVSQAPQASSEPAKVEKSFSQDEVARITGRVRDETRQEYYDRGKRDALATAQNTQPQSDQGSMGGMKQMTPQELEDLVSRKIAERENSSAAQQTAYDFTSKLLAAKDTHPDFEEVVSQLNLPNAPNIVRWANSLDNTADVIYDLGKNPSKYAHILMLNQSAPDLARREMQKLADSIKENAKAASQGTSRAPLDQLKPSTVGTDNGSMKIRDLRKQSWLRA